MCVIAIELFKYKAQNLPISKKGKQKQITGAFAVRADGDFVPMQLLYARKTDRCHLNGINFPEVFYVTHTPK